MATSYQVTEWNTGDTITKDKMNKIEKGIETNSKEFGNYATRIELSDYIPNSAKGVSVATLENGKIPMDQIPDSDTGQAISGYVKNVTSDGNATLTITTDSSPHNIKINNVENAVNAEVATKATQDSEGRQIDTTYLKLSGGTLTGDLNVSGHNITANNITGNLQGILLLSEQFPQNNFREVVFGSATAGAFLKPLYSKLANGVGTPTAGISWGSQNAQGFLQTHYGSPIAIIGGGAGVDGTSDIKWYRQIAFTESPTFIGTPTAPTPAARDNSTKLATTAFVKSQSASMQVEDIAISDNYWVKEPSGLITQFVEVEATTEEIEVPLPLAFSHKCLFVDVNVLNQEKDTSMDVKFNTIEKGLNSVKLLKIGTGTPKITVRVQGV